MNTLSGDFVLFLYSAKDFYQEGFLDSFLSLFLTDMPLFRPNRWFAEGATGGELRDFSAEKFAAAQQAFRDETINGFEFQSDESYHSCLTITRTPFLTTRLKSGRRPRALNSVRLYFSSDYFVDGLIEQSVREFLGIAIEMIQSIAPLYGIAHSYEDYRATASSIRASVTHHLPGAFWLNFFGANWVDRIGNDKLLSAPCWKREEVAGVGITVVLYHDPTKPTSEEAKSSRRLFANHIGLSNWIAKDSELDVAKRHYKRRGARSSASIDWREVAFRQLEQRVTDFHKRYEYDHAKGGKLPRNYDWRPYRFCVQDVMLGATVVKHARDDNCLIVDVFLTADIPEYEMGSGTRALTVFLLSEAFKCGGTMEIRFTRKVEGGRVPAALQQVALEAGMQLAHENKIMPAESRQLYLALTGFSPTLRQQIEVLDHVGMLSVERACYAVHHGVWTRPEVESIILGSRYPDSILGGKAQPEQRHLFLQDLLYARAAVLGSFLDRKLAKRDAPPEVNRVVELEDTERSIEITFEPKVYAKRYRCDQDPLPLPWLADDGPQLAPINPGDWLIALIRSRDVADLRRRFDRDLTMAQRVAATRSPDGAPHTVVVLVPHDFDELPFQKRQGWLSAAREAGIGILVCPETVASLDVDVAKRLARSRILRE